MKFQKVSMFQSKEKKEPPAPSQIVKVYDYDEPSKALVVKHRFFIMGCMVFIFALTSYILDVIFHEGQKLFPYGFSIISIIGIIATVLLPSELYRNRDVGINYPLNKVSSWHARGCPKRYIFIMIIVILSFVARLVLAIEGAHNEEVWPTNPTIAWVQVGLTLLSSLLMIYIVIRYHILNRKSFHLKEKPANEASYTARDLIRELSPFSWIFLVLLMIMIFFITLVV